MMRISLLGGVMLVSAVGLRGGPISQTGAAQTGTALYPDLQVVVPQHLALRTMLGEEFLYCKRSAPPSGAAAAGLPQEPRRATTAA